MIFKNMTSNEKTALKKTIDDNEKRLKAIKADPESFKPVRYMKKKGNEEKLETAEDRIDHLETQIESANKLVEKAEAA